jgi:two-component system sensor histidine kinase DesK
MLRHSAARNCVIEAEVAANTVRLMISNDGVPRVPSGPGGGGLDNLRNRMEAIGGKLSAEARGDGWFIVLAEASLEPRTEVESPQGAATRSPEGG